MNIGQIIFDVILNIVMFLVNLILIPIDAFIAYALPDLSAGFTKIASLFTGLSSALGFVISTVGLSAYALGLIAFYYTFKLTVPLQVWVIKLAVKWYHVIKP